MPKKEVKISELTPADNLTGLWTLGSKFINGVQTSVKVSFTLIQKAYDNALAAIRDAKTATDAAIEATKEADRVRAATDKVCTETLEVKSATDKVRQDTDKIRSETLLVKDATDKVRTETDKVRSDTLVVKNETDKVRQDTDKVREDTLKVKEGAENATSDATNAADRLNALSDHRDEIRDGYWWRWNEETGEWYNTGEIAKGNVMYATFDVDENNDLYMYTDEEYTGAGFVVDDEDLYVTLKTE